MGQGDQSPDQVRAAARHPHVGQHECRAVLVSGRHRGVAAGRLPDHPEVRLLSEQLGQGGRDAVVVVRDDDGDLATVRGRHTSTVAHGAPVVVMRARHSAGARALGAGFRVRVRLGA
jgi:hypothetical protein